VSPYIPASLVRVVRRTAHEACEYCLLPQNSQEATFHIDHIVPRQAGGPTEAGNLALACVTCSLRKAARLEAQDPVSLKFVRMFHPRQDHWFEHFSLTDEFELKGLTPIGRATVSALNMNRVAILSIRKELNFIGRFPPKQMDSR
jgi:hypothetical protein